MAVPVLTDIDRQLDRLAELEGRPKDKILRDALHARMIHVVSEGIVVELEKASPSLSPSTKEKNGHGKKAHD